MVSDLREEVRLLLQKGRGEAMTREIERGTEAMEGIINALMLMSAAIGIMILLSGCPARANAGFPIGDGLYVTQMHIASMHD